MGAFDQARVEGRMQVVLAERGDGTFYQCYRGSRRESRLRTACDSGSFGYDHDCDITRLIIPKKSDWAVMLCPKVVAQIDLTSWIFTQFIDPSVISMRHGDDTKALNPAPSPSSATGVCKSWLNAPFIFPRIWR